MTDRQFRHHILLSAAPGVKKTQFLTAIEESFNKRGIGLLLRSPGTKLVTCYSANVPIVHPEIDSVDLLIAAETMARLHGATLAHASFGLSKILEEAIWEIKEHRVCGLLLWNQFMAPHVAMRSLAQSIGLPVRFLEYGSLPGTFAYDKEGQMAESRCVVQGKRFRKRSLDDSDLESAKRYLEVASSNRISRKAPDEMEFDVRREMRKPKKGERVVLCIGQFDVHTGMVPRWSPRSRVHSPIFSDSIEAVRMVELLLGDHGYYICFKPHPNWGTDLATKWEVFEPKTSVVNKSDIFDCIDACDVVVTVLSQVAYLACMMDKPVVLLGRMQLSGSGAVYEVEHPSQIPELIKTACDRGMTTEMRRCWVDHVARMLKYELVQGDELVRGFVRRSVDDIVEDMASAITAKV